ncbi:uncharacterized protein LOC136029576 [Artemia franciscana]|uniref:Uncharacterized protein n=1 Tax=Artemia franciscana TaxID=6661 RepID=A0AA88KYX6_ARTSF|nr:hypothetical protein QYM36_015101 [Artemia franciscana]
MAKFKRYYDEIRDSFEEASNEETENDEGIEDSDDEAPDVISFSNSKKTVLETKESLLKFIREEEVKKKTKRKERDIQNKKQKEEKVRKIEEMKSKMLPEDILDAVSDVPMKITPRRKKGNKDDNQVKKERSSRPLLVATEDFIPLEVDAEATDFKIAVLEARPWKVQKPGIKPNETLASFRNSVLNRKNIRRENVASRNLALQKKIASGRSTFVK